MTANTPKGGRIMTADRSPAAPAAHTPGPWKIGSVGFSQAVCGPDGVRIAAVETRGDNWKESARLIASAPDLLAERDRLRAERDSLKAIADHLNGIHDEWRERVDKLRATNAELVKALEGLTEAATKAKPTVQDTWSALKAARAALAAAKGVAS